MDKNLTDNEIVKALECCAKHSANVHYMLTYQGQPLQLLLDNALDLINRQKAEIERLKNAYKQCARERDIFAEDMKEEIKKDCSYLALDIKIIKSEAYKEFAERLKEEKTGDQLRYGYQQHFIPIFEVDNLLKEMEGGASEVED